MGPFVPRQVQTERFPVFLQIYWLSGNYRMYVKSKAPGFQQVGRLNPIEVLAKENISIINVDYKRLFYNGLR